MRIHFIAIGGSAMHDLAIALHRQGYRVTGSDDAFFEPSRSRLQVHGLLPEKDGWDPDRISSELDRIILGMHAQKDNPELLKAQELGIPVQSFPEFVAERSREKERVVIAGSHGKTSITAMVLHVLRRYGMEPDRLVGAQLEGYDGAVRLTDEADRIVIEGDEYLSSRIDPRPKFLWYAPHIALISGIAWDHVNVFPSFEDYLDAFRRFIGSIRRGGTLIHCQEDEVLNELVTDHAAHLHRIPYRTHPHRNKEEGSQLITPYGARSVRIFGSHNMQNLSGAMALCQELKIDEESFYNAIRDFEGAELRLEELYKKGGSVAYRDYAHAPSKVHATVRAVKERYPQRPLFAVLELHTYSSLDPGFIDAYAKSMEDAEEAFVFYDPRAAEKKGFGQLDPERIREAFSRPDLQVHTDMDDLEKELQKGALGQEEKALLFMSSGPFQGKDLLELAADVLG
jgi:UDP-N-acetylmuramate: L-alanyl-gamma-D-glutamyl-meso-diaminopimelate ligase